MNKARGKCYGVTERILGDEGSGAGTLPVSSDELLAEALKLPRSERARVADELMASLEEPADDVAAGWAAELQCRSREVAEGRVQTESWEAVREEILKELEQRRAGRVSS